MYAMVVIHKPDSNELPEFKLSYYLCLIDALVSI